jgi:hypothetical protein
MTKAQLTVGDRVAWGDKIVGEEDETPENRLRTGVIVDWSDGTNPGDRVATVKDNARTTFRVSEARLRLI